MGKSVQKCAWVYETLRVWCEMGTINIRRARWKNGEKFGSYSVSGGRIAQIGMKLSEYGLYSGQTALSMHLFAVQGTLVRVNIRNFAPFGNFRKPIGLPFSRIGSQALY